MPITRTRYDQTSFQRKLLAYEAAWQQNLHRTRFGWQRFRVLTVTINSERLRKIIEAGRTLAHGHGLFLFLDALPWHSTRDSEMARLLP